MEDQFNWERTGRKVFALKRKYPVPERISYLRSNALTQTVACVVLCKNDNGTTAWRAVPGNTYHRTKKQAIKYATIKYKEQSVMGRPRQAGKIPDLTNAYWSTEMIGEHRFDVLRVRVNGEMHQVASIDERGNPQFWAAIRGRGQVPLDGANTFEEAQAVCVALIRMGG